MARQEPLIDLRPIANAIGRFLQERAKDRFNEQAFDGQEWPERSVPNLAGIISDLKRGRRPTQLPKRRFEGRPALIDEGTLKKSIGYEVSDDGTLITVGSPLPYAQRMQEGGKSTIQIPSDVRQGLRKVAGSNQVKQLPDPDAAARRLIAASRKEEIEIDVPARPFLGLDEQDIDDIMEMLEL